MGTGLRHRQHGQEVRCVPSPILPLVCHGLLQGEHGDGGGTPYHSCSHTPVSEALSNLDQRAHLNRGGVSNVGIDGNNALQIKAIGVVISTFETLPDKSPTGPRH